MKQREFIIASEKIPIFAVAFTVAYAVIYAICTELNLPLLTYHPAIGELDFLWKSEKRGPSMYWYGWMLTSLVGALLLAWIATLVPEQWLQRAITFGCVGAAAYLILYSLALFVLRSGQRRARVPQVALAGDRSRNRRRGGHQPARARVLEETVLAGLGMGGAARRAYRVGLLSQPLFRALGRRGQARRSRSRRSHASSALSCSRTPSSTCAEPDEAQEPSLEAQKRQRQ